MVMVRVEPVNSWGGGHAARPGASRANARLANISTSVGSGEDSTADRTAVVNCESPVTPPSRLARESANCGPRIGSQDAQRDSSKALRTALACVYRVWTRLYESNQPSRI